MQETAFISGVSLPLQKSPQVAVAPSTSSSLVEEGLSQGVDLSKVLEYWPLPARFKE